MGKAFDKACRVYQLYYSPSLATIRTLAELREVEKDVLNVWVIFSFTRGMRLRFPELYDCIEANYHFVSTHPGTIEYGTIFVVRRAGPV